MKISPWLVLVILSLLITACNGASDQTTPSPQPSATLSQPGVNTTQAPDVLETINAYLDAWEDEDYPVMYQLLTSISQDAITEEQFERVLDSLNGLPEPGTHEWERTVDNMRFDLENDFGLSKMVQGVRDRFKKEGRNFEEEFEEWKKKNGRE